MEVEPDPTVLERRWLLREGAVLATVALLGTALFWLTDLDIATVRPFFHPGGTEPWPVAGQWLFRVCYQSAPWLTGGLALAGSSLLILGVVRQGARRLRVYGLFILLSVILGPGLLVNLVFKDHWGRPRPRQVLALGGTYPYVPPLLRAATPGKSFPCGHCSVAYLYALGWWILRRRQPRWATASLVLGLFLGTLLGLGRMAAGGHFLSDVMWSGLLAFGVAHALYHHILRIPQQEVTDPPVFQSTEHDPRLRWLVISAATVLGAGVIGGGILASPHFKDLAGHRSLDECSPPPTALDLRLDHVDLEIRLIDEPGRSIESSGWIHGFGLPTNRIETAWACEPAGSPTLRFRLVEQGWFTDLDGLLHLDIPLHAFQRVQVRVEVGDVRVLRVPDRALAGSGADLPQLDIQSHHGRVEVPGSSGRPSVQPLLSRPGDGAAP